MNSLYTLIGYNNLKKLNLLTLGERCGGDGREKRFVVDIKSIVNGAKENFYLDAGDIVFVGERFF